MTTVADATSAGALRWVSDPIVPAGAVLLVCYLAGRGRILDRNPTSRLTRRTRTLWFLLGTALLVAILSPPMDDLADELLAAHMVQHLTLGLVVPLAFVAARPVPVLARGLPGGLGQRLRRIAAPLGRSLRRISTPVALGLVSAHVLTFAVWHIPSAYDLAVEDPAVHVLEHLMMLASGLGLWWVVLHVRWQDSSGLAVLELFLVGLPMGALGALLTLAPAPIYTAHLATAGRWGLTALQDQQLAGGIMWVPGGLIYLAAACALFVRWLAAGPAPGEEVLRWGA